MAHSQAPDEIRRKEDATEGDDAKNDSKTVRKPNGDDDQDSVKVSSHGIFLSIAQSAGACCWRIMTKTAMAFGRVISYLYVAYFAGKRAPLSKLLLSLFAAIVALCVASLLTRSTHTEFSTMRNPRFKLVPLALNLLDIQRRLLRFTSLIEHASLRQDDLLLASLESLNELINLLKKLDNLEHILQEAF